MNLEWKSSNDIDLQSILDPHEVQIDEVSQQPCSKYRVRSSELTFVLNQVGNDISLAAQKLQVETDLPDPQDPFKVRSQVRCVRLVASCCLSASRFGSRRSAKQGSPTRSCC